MGSKNHLLVDIGKQGLHRALKFICPVRKESGEDSGEFLAHIARKIAFDLGITSLRSLSDFKVQSAAMPHTFTSGVVVMEIAKHSRNLLWLRLGEMSHELDLILGEHRRGFTSDGELLDREDYTHVTRESIEETIPKFVGEIKHRLLVPSTPEGTINEMPAISHEITIQAFEPPVLKLRVRSGAGFRMSNFLRDFSAELGTVAHATRIHRSTIGPYTYDDALPSYAVSLDNCRRVSEKYRELLKQHNYKTRHSFAPGQIEEFLGENRYWRLFYKNIEKRREKLSKKRAYEESDSIESG